MIVDTRPDTEGRIGALRTLPEPVMAEALRAEGWWQKDNGFWMLGAPFVPFPPKLFKNTRGAWLMMMISE